MLRAAERDGNTAGTPRGQGQSPEAGSGGHGEPHCPHSDRTGQGGGPRYTGRAAGTHPRRPKERSRREEAVQQARPWQQLFSVQPGPPHVDAGIWLERVRAHVCMRAECLLLSTSCPTSFPSAWGSSLLYFSPRCFWVLGTWLLPASDLLASMPTTAFTSVHHLCRPPAPGPCSDSPHLSTYSAPLLFLRPWAISACLLVAPVTPSPLPACTAPADGAPEPPSCQLPALDLPLGPRSTCPRDLPAGLGLLVLLRLKRGH